MSTMPNTDRGFWQRWKEFWFTPGDPTTLGFIRIVTGLLILYIHLAYSLDLQAFFGRYGWYGAAYVERERHEYPWVMSSFGKFDPEKAFGWDEEVAQPQVPEHPHRRQAVLRFIRSLPTSADERARSLRFLERICGEPPQMAVAGLGFLDQFYKFSLPPEEGGSQPGDEAARQAETKKVYAALTEGRQLYASVQTQGVFYLDTANLAQNTPKPFFLAGSSTLPEHRPGDCRQRPSGTRGRVAPKQDGCNVSVCPPDANSTPPSDEALLQFIKELPADAAKRERLTEYLEYWNRDPNRPLPPGPPPGLRVVPRQRPHPDGPHSRLHAGR
jgi:hypothetical protein